MIRPTAITGTWSDLERRAEYLYENADVGSDAQELAEAVLVLADIQHDRHVLQDALERIVIDCSHCESLPEPCPVCLAEVALEKARS